MNFDKQFKNYNYNAITQKKVAKKLDLKVSINMENDFNSLNVSAAAAILIYQLKR